jgi:hypothetical protein
MIEDPTEIAAQQSEDSAQDKSDSGSRQGQQDDDMGTIRSAAENVPAELVDPEGVLQAHAGKRPTGRHLGGRVGHSEGTEKGEQKVRSKDYRADPKSKWKAVPAMP